MADDAYQQEKQELVQISKKSERKKQQNMTIDDLTRQLEDISKFSLEWFEIKREIEDVIDWTLLLLLFCFCHCNCGESRRGVQIIVDRFARLEYYIVTLSPYILEALEKLYNLRTRIQTPLNLGKFGSISPRSFG